jgi:hypothetical protein
MKSKKTTPGVTFEMVRESALTLPGVEDGTSYGTPALKVKGKLLARLKEDGESVVFRVGFDEREVLMRAKPRTFYITDHYKDYPAVLMRMPAATRADLANIVNLAWRFSAPKRLLSEATNDE